MFIQYNDAYVLIGLHMNDQTIAGRQRKKGVNDFPLTPFSQIFLISVVLTFLAGKNVVMGFLVNY